MRANDAPCSKGRHFPGRPAMNANLSAPSPHASPVHDLLGFIDASPTPWHAVATLVQRLQAAGFTALDERDAWSLRAGDQRYVVRDDSALIAFRVGHDADAAFRIIGAHTDSPGLRVKTQGVHASGGYVRLNCEIYGGPILATFTDRDLMLAGRVQLRDDRDPRGWRSALYRSPSALVRLPNLAIHLNRGVNEDGLKVHKHRELNLLLQTLGQQTPREHLLALLADALNVSAADILGFDLLVADTQASAFFGANQEFIAARQLDNLASCHAAVSALLATDRTPANTQVIALFDHEEVGSESLPGAGGTLLPQVLQRIAAPASSEAFARRAADSWLMSADMAHAAHPSHPDCFDGHHNLTVNNGPALKINASQRYATTSEGEALFRLLCTRHNIPHQAYVHRADLSCGTTIGPISAARLGIRTFDVGAPMWAMHSARESAGAHDHQHYIALMQAFLAY